jgi:hypothetical protein
MGLFITTRELSKRTGVRPGTILQWVHRRRVQKPFRIGWQYLWPEPMVKEIESIRDRGTKHAD